MTNLAQYLKKKKLRQYQFAELVGVKQSFVSRLKAGHVMPSLELAVKIERATKGAVKAVSWVSE